MCEERFLLNRILANQANTTCIIKSIYKTSNCLKKHLFINILGKLK